MNAFVDDAAPATATATPGPCPPRGGQAPRSADAYAEAYAAAYAADDAAALSRNSIAEKDTAASQEGAPSVAAADVRLSERLERVVVSVQRARKFAPVTT